MSKLMLEQSKEQFKQGQYLDHETVKNIATSDSEYMGLGTVQLPG